MADHCEEQEMEAEALTAIFDDCLEVVSDTQPFEWAISIWPEQLSPEENHVGVKLVAKIPLDYPEVSLPEFDMEVLQGLTDDHKSELLDMAKEEAEANMGLPSIFAVCEKLREWLIENNVKGMDDVSMYAQMMRREKEKERQEQKAQQAFEAQKERTELTEAEAEELAVRKRRAEGTPVTKDTFEEWKEKFQNEMEEEKRLAQEEAQKATDKKGSKKEKVVDKSGRITGFKFFEEKSFNFEAMELACENAQRDEDEEDDDDVNDGEDADVGDNVVNEGLFDVDDDDLDDLDFDDDDDDETPDI